MHRMCGDMGLTGMTLLRQWIHGDEDDRGRQINTTVPSSSSGASGALASDDGHGARLVERYCPSWLQDQMGPTGHNDASSTGASSTGERLEQAGQQAAPSGGPTTMDDFTKERSLQAQAQAMEASSIHKYMFSDEGEKKDTVKVYIEACELDNGSRSFTDVNVDFTERSMLLKATTNDGRLWVLRAAPLSGSVKPDECSYALSTSGHRVRVTLKKDPATAKWKNLTDESSPSLQDSSGTSFM